MKEIKICIKYIDVPASCLVKTCIWPKQDKIILLLCLIHPVVFQDDATHQALSVETMLIQPHEVESTFINY